MRILYPGLFLSITQTALAHMPTKIYGLIGHPLGHSFSAHYFNNRFSEEGTDARYLLWDIDSTALMRSILEQYRPEGFNVTIPYKEQILPLLTELHPTARAVGAVNTVKVTYRSDGTPCALTGYNTDTIGFKQSLEGLLDQASAKPRQALVLGTGGASKAVAFVLRSLGIEPHLVSRTPGANGARYSYTDLTEEVMAAHTLIVNTTPLGTYPDIDTFPPIPYELITATHICHDLVYNPARTRFMQLAAAQGAKVKNGQEMLLAQAIAAYNIWTADTPPSPQP